MQKLKRVGVLSFAKITGLAYGALAVLFIPIVLIVALGSSVAGQQGDPFAPLGTFGAIIFALLMPIIYAAMGFLMGGLMAFLYNVVAARVGGIEVEFGS